MLAYIAVAIKLDGGGADKPLYEPQDATCETAIEESLNGQSASHEYWSEV